MKRRDLIRRLEVHGCRLVREGGSHTVYVIPERKKYPQCRAIEKSMRKAYGKIVRYILKTHTLTAETK
ncbi:MAG TPA: type II toxin-antitoxin system HicA family toxin [Syntrophobacteraceae bacterium]|nr:type II toxin-antitoxin system HicA family toxin [Syntrophobacteraceae bacterium]